MQRPVLVGEDNPYSRDPRHALLYAPPHSAGGRLCRLILRHKPAHYLREYERVNLCTGKWNEVEARGEAAKIASRVRGAAPIVLLGAKVCRAFAVRYEPHSSVRVRVVPEGGERWDQVFAVLPHPSARCRAWNEPGAFDRAREVLRAAGVPVGDGP